MHWCLGMYGSASTWTFNLVQKLAATLAPDRPVVPHFVADSLADLDATAGTLVVKTHAAPVAAGLAQRASAIIITIRDPRDAIASLMAHNKAPFDLAVNVTAATAFLCGRFARHDRAILLRFEDRFYDNPETIEKIAATFPGTLSDEARDRLFAETRRAAVDALIAQLETLPTTECQFDTVTGQQDIFDPVTGWHKHHAGRKGEIGRWQRDLSRSQVAAIEERLRPWMVHFGYRPTTLPSTGAPGAPPAQAKL
ncbi:MAG: sulfotransferase domain-containing protein [Acetobacteraceae bacterium]|nr:sulfotransferase domain-containing protein [Acetobacteraceae bacterium]